MSYKIKLEIFEGPLDLLLYLIKKDEIDISDIPIAKITDQYLEYLELMKMLDLNIAGEFIVMAATLMHIKSKMLLPPVEAEEEVEEEDPRAELVRRLLEYKRFKEVANELMQREHRQKNIYFRHVSDDVKGAASEEAYFEASLFDLISAFNKVMKEVPRESFHAIVKDEFTVEEKMHDIFHILVNAPAVYFTDLFRKAKSKLEIICTFLALLELMRLKEIVVRQRGNFGTIEIMRNREVMEPKYQTRKQHI